MPMYDRGHDTTFKATITQFDWVNPHTQITFTVTDDHENTRNGWRKALVRTGEQITARERTRSSRAMR